MATDWLGQPTVGLPQRDDAVLAALTRELCVLRDELHRLAAEVAEGVVSVERYQEMARCLTDVGLRLWGEGQRLAIQRGATEHWDRKRVSSWTTINAVT